jgi:hypothetical protein
MSQPHILLDETKKPVFEPYKTDLTDCWMAEPCSLGKSLFSHLSILSKFKGWNRSIFSCQNPVIFKWWPSGLLCYVFWLYANVSEDHTASTFRTDDPVIFEFLYRNTALCSNHSWSFCSTGREIRNWTAQYEADRTGGTCWESPIRQGSRSYWFELTPQDGSWSGWRARQLTGGRDVVTPLSLQDSVTAQQQPGELQPQVSFFEQKLLSIHLDKHAWLQNSLTRTLHLFISGHIQSDYQW